jgi:translocation and assembly module TamB
MALASAARDPAANAERRSARFGRRRLRPARGGSNVARRYCQRRDRQPGASNRLCSLTTDGALDVKIDGALDARLANTLLSVSGRHVASSLAIALQLRGTMAKPQAQGAVRLTSGEFRDDQTGFKLTAITGTLAANGDTIRIDRLAGTTPDAGSIAGNGEVRLDPAAGFPGSIRLTGERARIVANDIVSATANLALDVSGPLLQKPRVDGSITIVGMDIAVPERFNSVASPIPGTRHLNPTPTAQARLALIAKAKGPGARAPLFDATLALTISAANRVFVRGRGIYAELGGDLHVSGSARDPQVTGGFDLLRGSLTLSALASTSHAETSVFTATSCLISISWPRRARAA